MCAAVFATFSLEFQKVVTTGMGSSDVVIFTVIVCDCEVVKTQYDIQTVGLTLKLSKF